ncbi:MAG: hypothetical protein K2F87_00310 [Muribaculaceae bacterium]|nr:hypothetical protein [Muribaculaceae bacterium]
MDPDKTSNTPSARPQPAQSDIPSTGAATPRKPAHHIWKWIGITAGSLAGLILLILIGITIFLSPARLTEIVNREASQYLNADIHAEEIDYTLWSSLPRLRITTGPITVRSRTLDSIPDSIRRHLPANADFLGSIKSFQGSINVVDLFLNRYVVHDVAIDSLRINIVAYNDSINNYNIAPETGQKLKSVPYFSARQVTLNHPGALTYYSYATDTRASLQLADLDLHRVERKEEENAYRLSLGGQVTATSSGIKILTDFPFSLGGDLTLRFKPFGVALTDYAIDLGEIHSTLSMSVGIGDDPRVESFNYKIKSVNLMNLLGYLPKEYIPSLEGLKADMPISASARLLTSWSMSSEVFPTIEVDFDIPQGEIDYTVSSSPAGGALHTYRLNHSPMKGIFVFNGERPDSSYLEIPRFSVFSSGVDARVSARVTDLTAQPLIRASVNIDADIAEALRLVPTTSPVNADGRLTSNTDISFRIASFSREALSQGMLDLRTAGDFRVEGLTMRYPADNITIRINRLTADLGEDALALTPQALDNPKSRVSINIDHAVTSTPFGQFTAGNLRLLTTSTSPDAVTPEAFREGLPLHFRLTGDDFHYADPASGVAVDVAGINISDVVATTSPRSFREALSDGLNVSAGRVAFSTGDATFTLRRPDLRLAVAERNAEVLDSLPAMLAAAAPVKPVRHERSGDMAAEPAHTPKLLSVNVPPQLKRILSGFRFNTDLKVGRVDLDAPGFRGNDHLADIDLSLNEEALELRSLSVNLSDVPAHVSGRLANLRGFLTGPVSEQNPLIIDLKANVPNININTLTANYVKARGGEKAVRDRSTTSPSDTVAMLIPRNIRASINATCGDAIYTNLDLTDVKADIDVAGGVATVNRLAMAASFGRAEASFVYNTADLYNMGLSADLKISDVNIVKFFDKFPSLIRMMPEMRNLSGFLSIDGTLSGSIFPTMYLNVPSAAADLNLHGTELLVHQSPFIRKITRMMLIRTDKDIHIADIDVQAGIHDNLLQLYPFNFEFDRYKLHMLGVNNFNGRLYYHIDVAKSPVHFPFSINIEGWFHNPKLRFGRAAYDIRRGEEVTSEIVAVDKLNLIHIMRGFTTEFVVTGAKYAK